MIERRNVLKSALGFGAALSTPALMSRYAEAGTRKFEVNVRGFNGRHERVPVLDLESRIDFTAGYRRYDVVKARLKAEERAKEIFRDKNITVDTFVDWDDVVELVDGDPVIGAAVRNAVNNQKMMWGDLQQYFHANADAYLAELEETDSMGPGSLELSPDLVLPEYTTHEIHQQPGGYVGDPLIGYVFYHGTNSFRMGRNFQDQQHRAIARAMPLTPKNGDIRRVLDMGCSHGTLTMALKERFPDAEVWGLDCAAPMVRYAHMRAVDLNSDVHYVQQLAEDTKFPDNHFDVVASYLLFHEVNSEAAEKIIHEAARILRPGGAYFAWDIRNWKQLPRPSPYRVFQGYWIWRWQHEVWIKDHRQNDYEQMLTDAGFDFTIRDSDGRITATKKT